MQFSSWDGRGEQEEENKASPAARLSLLLQTETERWAPEAAEGCPQIQNTPDELIKPPTLLLAAFCVTHHPTAAQSYDWIQLCSVADAFVRDC